MTDANTTAMAAISINTSHAGYSVRKKQTPLGPRWSVMVEMAGKRKKEIVLCRSESAAATVVYNLTSALVALHEAGRAIANAMGGSL